MHFFSFFSTFSFGIEVRNARFVSRMLAADLYACESGVMPSVYEGTSDAIMNGILNLAFAPGKLFTVASYFHSSESTVCANGQNAPEIVATSATFCSATSTVTLCNSTHVEELACASGCGAASCTTTSSTRSYPFVIQSEYRPFVDVFLCLS
jgi:hypothetical protein